MLEIRKDKKRAQQIKRFSEWTKRELTGKSPAEINDIFEHELKEYKDALKVHGTCGLCKENGAEVLVAGSAYFKAADRTAFVKTIQK